MSTLSVLLFVFLLINGVLSRGGGGGGGTFWVKFEYVIFSGHGGGGHGGGVFKCFQK